MEMLLKNFLQTFELYHLTFSQELEGKEWIASNMRDPSTKDGMCIVGDPGEGPGGLPPLFFYHTEARRVEKVSFFEIGSPPLYLRVWMTGLPRYLKVWIPQRRGFVQGGIQGGARGARLPLIFWPNWGPKGGKSFFFWDRVPPPLPQGLNDRATPLSEGVEPPLV